MKDVHIGCSSFYNRKWSGIFYPEDLPSKDWFRFYANQFKTFEINATFYKFPTLRIMQNWYDRSPSGFLYSIKAPKIITHLKRFEDCKDELSQFYRICKDGLAEKLGCLLFQLPPSFSYDENRLQLILSQLDNSFTNVVEFRNETWWRDDVKQAFTDRNIVFCSVSYPKLPDEITVTNNISYLRLHGNPRLFYSEYDSSELQKFNDRMPESGKSFVYFNNTASEAGIKNALELLERLNSDSN